jgi:hypothetical protein
MVDGKWDRQEERRIMMIVHRTFDKLPGRMLDDLLKRRERMRLQVEEFIRNEIDEACVVSISEASDNNGFTITVWYRVDENDESD